MNYYCQTHKGNIRAENEDCLFAPGEGGGFFAVVADGMGGHNAGEVASRIAVDTIISAFEDKKPEMISKKDIKLALSLANKNVWKDAEKNVSRRGMGSTVTLAVFRDGQALIGHVGDSRAYLFRGNTLSQITKDHSYVQMLLDNGYIKPEEAANHPQKNIITRAVGTETDVDAEVYLVDTREGDVLLLCTDGLNVSVTDDKIKKIIKKDVSKAAERLIKAALDDGGRDNITVVVAQMGGEPE